MTWTRESLTRIGENPYTLEVVRYVLNREPFEFGIQRLTVGIKDDEEIRYIAKYRWPERGSKPKIIEQYNFVNDRLVSLSPDAESGPYIKLTEGEMLPKDLLFYFVDLGEKRPQLAGSLGRCVGGLLIPAPSPRPIVERR